MGWRERLQPASFKGAPFWVDSLQRTGGRRVPVRRLIGVDGSRQQDLGAEPKAFDVVAYLFGDDYDLALEELEEKLSSPGPGALSLPTRGDLWARVTEGPVSTEEPRTRGGYATVRFSVVLEDRAAGTLRARPDTAQQLKAASTAVTVSAQADFAESFDASSLPDRHYDRVLGTIRGAAEEMRATSGRITSALNVVSDVTLALEELDRANATLLSAPSDLATRLVDLVLTVVGLADTSTAGIDRTTGLVRMLLEAPYARSAPTRATRQAASALSTFGDDSESTPATTSAGERARQSVRATARLVRAASLARACEAYATAPFDSASSAADTLDELNEQLDALVLFDAPDDLVEALELLRARAAAHLSLVASGLPNTMRLAQRVEVNAITLAHELYGDARLEADIVARNQLPDPLLITGELEVLAP